MAPAENAGAHQLFWLRSFMALDHLLKEARKARLTDDYESAIKLCRAYLDVNPNSPDGESLLGLCEIETGRREGEARIVRAAEAAPKNAALQLNLSILRELQGDLRNAVIHASSAAKLDPHSFEAWAQLGKLLGKGEKFDEAYAALQQAAAIRRDHPGVMMLLASAALEIGELDASLDALSAIERLGVPVSETRRLRAHLLRRRGDPVALESFAMEWLKAAPGEEEPRVALAFALAEQGYYDRAAATFAPLASMQGASADKLAAMGRYLLGGRRLDEAAHWFKRALKADPADTDANFGMARRSMFLGELQDAEAWCRRTIAASPLHAEAYGVLVEATRGKISESDFAALEEALGNARQNSEDRIKLLFARGDALHARKDAGAAFGAWTEANREKKARAAAVGNGYDRRAQQEKTDAIIRLFPKPRTPDESTAPSAPAPIFIVGMPRSGTTLLESAICAHPEVDGAGEVPAMPFYLDEYLGWARSVGTQPGVFPPGAQAAWREGYVEQCRKFGWAGAPCVTDKQPSNIFAAGFAATLFPRARFVHIRRNPVETGLSIFRRNFNEQWPFSADLEDIVHYYFEHLRIAEHWRSTLAGRFAFVQYEELVENFEGSMRDILQFCGLPWDEACLRYHEQDRAVMTFSAAQVREPPSKARLSSTGPYRAALAPLERALDALGIDLETGALRVRH